MPSPETPNKYGPPKPTTPKHKIQRHYILWHFIGGIQAKYGEAPPCHNPSNNITSNLFSRIGNQSLLMKLRK